MSIDKNWQHWDDLSPEKEKELIDKMASFIVDNNLGLMAQILFESGEPVTRIFSTLGIGLFGPYLEFFGVDTVFALFRKQGNVHALIERINELEDEKLSINKNKK